MAMSTPFPCLAPLAVVLLLVHDRQHGLNGGTSVILCRDGGSIYSATTGPHLLWLSLLPPLNLAPP